MREGVWIDSERERKVTVKSVFTNFQMDKLRLLQEAAIIVQFNYPYIVEVYGVNFEVEEVSGKEN